MLNNPAGEEKLLLRALEIDPDLTDARSRYSQFLVERNTPEAAAEALKQLHEVRKRLNSSELWEREAQALWLLGREEEAARAHAIYRDRMNANRP